MRIKDNLIYMIFRGDTDDKEIFKIVKDYDTAVKEVYNLINYPEKYFGWTTVFNSIEVWDISKDINEKAEYIITIDDITTGIYDILERTQEGIYYPKDPYKIISNTLKGDAKWTIKSISKYL